MKWLDLLHHLEELSEHELDEDVRVELDDEELKIKNLEFRKDGPIIIAE